MLKEGAHASKLEKAKLSKQWQGSHLTYDNTALYAVVQQVLCSMCVAVPTPQTPTEKQIGSWLWNINQCWAFPLCSTVCCVYSGACGHFYWGLGLRQSHMQQIIDTTSEFLVRISSIFEIYISNIHFKYSKYIWNIHCRPIVNDIKLMKWCQTVVDADEEGRQLIWLLCCRHAL